MGRTPLENKLTHCRTLLTKTALSWSVILLAADFFVFPNRLPIVQRYARCPDDPVVCLLVTGLWGGISLVRLSNYAPVLAIQMYPLSPCLVCYLISHQISALIVSLVDDGNCKQRVELYPRL